MRVQIPAYTDRWMMGDRYGEVVKIVKGTGLLADAELVHVKLDKSGKVRVFFLTGCTEV